MGSNKGNKVEAYKTAAEDALEAMSKAASTARAALADAGKAEKEARESFREGIYGSAGLSNVLDGIKADRESAAESLDAAIEKAREAVSEARESAFSINPSDVPDGLFEVLRGVDMTSDELARMVEENKGTSYTAVRAAQAAARRAGMDVKDNAPGFLSAVDGELDSFAGYCRGMARSGAYDASWGAIVAGAVEAIEKAYTGYMGAPWA